MATKEPATSLTPSTAEALRAFQDSADTGLQKPTSKLIEFDSYRRPYVGYAASPFRYPGGKGVLTSLLADEIRQRFPNRTPHYAEPYCGGAGAALNLLVAGLVDQVLLNDADHRIFSAWSAMAFETDRFLDRLNSTPVDLPTWEKCLLKLHEPKIADYDFEVGFSAFFINRTSRSGVIIGSGPIGGYNQEGTWKIDARFNKEGLGKKIQAIGSQSSRIVLTCSDGLDFCKMIEADRKLDDTFLFIDPPYVGAGGRLYYDGMSEAKHRALAQWLRAGAAPHWWLTYDDHPLVRENYSEFDNHGLELKYSLSRRRPEKELLYKSQY